MAGSKMCNYLDVLFGKLVTFASRIDTQKTINLFRIDKDCVWLDMLGEKKLYALKIENRDNTIVRFGKQLNMLIPSMRYSEHSELALFFVNKDKHQAIYLYSFDEKVISQLSRDLRIPSLQGNDIVASLLDSMLIQRYAIKENRLVRTGFSAKPFMPYGLEMASGKFRAKVEIATDNIVREYGIYQGVEYENTSRFSPIDLFRIDWDGCIALWFNFSAIAAEARVKRYEATAKFGDKDFANECMAIIQKTDVDFMKEIKENSYIINSIAIIKDEKSMNQISDAMSIVFEKNYLTGPSIASKTILMARDADFDAILPKEAILKYFASSHKTQTPDDFDCDFSGIDISGNIIDYSFKNNDNPHTILTGKTGSGKSVQAIGIMEGILGFNHADKTASNIEKVKIRYCDVGYTSGRFMRDLKTTHPNNVEIFGSDVSALRFGLFDFDLRLGKFVPEEEMDFLTSFISFALEIDRIDPLVGLEQAFFKNCVNELFAKGTYTDLYIEDLILDGGYANVVESILAEGFSMKSKASDLPDKYDFLKKPILKDLLVIIETLSHSGDAKPSDKAIYESLYRKINTINANPMINKYSNTEFATRTNIFHIDFDEIKNNVKAFNISYWMIMKKWLKGMKADAIPRFDLGLEPITTFFFIEEAHNFFKYKSFSDMLTTAAKEVRKFGGRLFFITQDIEDLPEKVYQELATKIFISSAAEKERYKKIARKVYPQGDMDPIDEVIDYLDDRMLLILSDKGVLGCKLMLGADIKYYKPLKI